MFKLIIALLGLLSLTSCQSTEDLARYKDLIKSNNAIGLDVRTPQELTENPAQGAKHIPLNELSKKTDELDKNQKILIFCEAGGRASAAKELLESKGFTNVENIGDWRTWNKIKDFK